MEDGSYLLEVPYSEDQELIMDILRHGRPADAGPGGTCPDPRPVRLTHILSWSGRWLIE